jgi:hypothetical protein
MICYLGGEEGLLWVFGMGAWELYDYYEYPRYLATSTSIKALLI